MANPEVKDLSLGLWIGAVGIGLSTACLMMRIYTKTAVTKSMSIDDLLATLSWLFAVGVQSIVIYLRMTKKLGVHLYQPTAPEAGQASALIFVAAIVYIAVLASAKSSLLVFLRHMSSSRLLKLLNLLAIAIIAAYSLAYILLLIFGCKPIRKSWDTSVKGGSCVDRSAIYLAVAAADSATNLALFVLSIPIVSKLRTTIGQKIGLLGIYIVGGLTLAVSCVLAVILPRAMKYTDITWAASSPAIWASAEASLVVICACLPTLPEFVKSIAPGRFGDDPSTQGRGSRDDFENQIRMRPASALTIFKGRSVPKQVWRQMPEEDIPSTDESRAPMRKANKQDTFSGFDFGLEKQDAIATTREIKTQKQMPQDERNGWV